MAISGHIFSNIKNGKRKIYDQWASALQCIHRNVGSVCDSTISPTQKKRIMGIHKKTYDKLSPRLDMPSRKLEGICIVVNPIENWARLHATIFNCNQRPSPTVA